MANLHPTRAGRRRACMGSTNDAPTSMIRLPLARIVARDALLDGQGGVNISLYVLSARG
jgi:hypothetical protein